MVSWIIRFLHPSEREPQQAYLWSYLSPQMVSGGSKHPLDPLTATETAAAAECCKAFFAARFPNVGQIRFNTVTLDEPPKDKVIEYEKNPCPETTPPRMAFCILQPPYRMFQDGEEPYIVEAIVQLEPEVVAVHSWRQLTSVQPLLSPDDCFEAEAIAKADALVQEALAARYNITDPETQVACDPWSVHEHGSLRGRLCQLFMYQRLNPDDNHYAHPLDMVVVVDLAAGKVIKIEADEEPHKVNVGPDDYHRNLMKGGFRAPPKPLDIVQPEGPSFEVQGNLVTWQKWSLRVGWNYREGLVLHQVGYEDGGRVRPILYRASLVEMAVPYAEPRAPYNRKCAFDVGDYGLGNCANSLELGCDCLGHIHYFDAVLNNAKGEPVTLRKAICMHEEDYGLLWKHLDYRSGHVESRRSRRLVISFIATVVNYEYLFYYYFYQDGTIQYEIKLSGELSTNALSAGETSPEFGIFVTPLVNAQHHQHMFCARLDFALDDSEGGKGGLQVVEQEVVALEPHATTNPSHNAFKVTETIFEDEHAAQRQVCPTTARTWVVRNPKVTNRFGRPVGYKLQTAAGPCILAHPSSLIARKGAFATKNLWVTPYAEGERWPAGDYTIQSPGGKGLPEWTAKNRPVKDVDVVVWHCFGVTHVVREEDFPVMPCEVVGFTLKPVGFFARNPGVDLPPETNKASRECCDKPTCATQEGTETGGCCGPAGIAHGPSAAEGEAVAN